MVHGSPALFLLLAAAPLFFVHAARRVDITEHSAALQAFSALSLALDGCQYAEDSPFQVGDMVRISKPGSTANNAVNEVVCPQDTTGASGNICLSRGGCWSPDNLRKMNPLDIALQGLKRRVHVAKITYGPVVQEKLSSFAAITQEKAAEVGQKVLAAVNVCDPEVQAQMRQVFAAVRSRIESLADAGTEAEPEAKEKLETFAAATQEKIVALGAMLSEKATDVAESDRVKAMITSMHARVDELKAASFEKLPPRAQDVLASINDLSDKVAELSARATELAQGAYQAERTQAVLASIQAGAGKLASAAVEKWPEVKSALEEFAGASAEKVAELSGKAVEAVNLCNPEKREQVQAAFAVVQSRVSQLATAVAERLPEVQESLQDYAESMNEKVAAISEQVSEKIQDLREREQVQTMLATIKDQVAKLNAVIADKSGTMQEDPNELAASIEANLQQLVPEVFEAENHDEVDGGSEAAEAWEMHKENMF